MTLLLYSYRGLNALTCNTNNKETSQLIFLVLSSDINHDINERVTEAKFLHFINSKHFYVLSGKMCYVYYLSFFMYIQTEKIKVYILYSENHC